MEKDTITSIFNKLEILNFFYLRMSLSKAGKKSVNRLSSIQKEKKSAVLVKVNGNNKEEVNADKNCLQSSSFSHRQIQTHACIQRHTRCILSKKAAGLKGSC